MSDLVTFAEIKVEELIPNNATNSNEETVYNQGKTDVRSLS